MTVNVYHYHPETKEYLGLSPAKLDPGAISLVVEQAEEGQKIDPIYRLPKNATFIAPTNPGASYVQIFENAVWVAHEDHRSETYYNEAREPVIIDFIGEVEGLTQEPRELTDEEKWESVRNERNLKLSETDKYVLPDYPISEQDKAAIYQYRKKLRDVTDDYETPDAVIIPDQPEVDKISSGD